MTVNRGIGVKWESALHDLAVRLDTALHIERYEFPERRRKTGDWWRNKEHWCVHLDYRHYAWLEESSLASPVVQRTISWSLEVLSANQPVRWQDILLDWAIDLSVMPREALFQNIYTGQSFPVGANLSLQLPGYFVCLSLDDGRRLGGKDADTPSIVSEVVEALLPRGWITWLPDDAQGAIAIVYLCEDDILSNEELDEDVGSKSSEALSTVFLMMRQLTQALAADAMVSCRAAVGARIVREKDLYYGVATALAAWRTREWIAPTETVFGWGADPAETLLLALPNEGIDTFMRVASARKVEADLHMPNELIETLFGLIDANLNVSEASRLLYLHRNTLMNRIDRIKQQTGYDVRVFRDAMTLWLVTAVHRMTQ